MELSDGHHSSSSRRGNLICNTVRTWSVRSLSATGSTDTSVAVWRHLFQSLSSSGSSGNNCPGQGSVPTQYARGLLHDDKFWRLVLPCEDSRYFVLLKQDEHLFPQAEGCRFRICSLSINPDLLGRLTATSRVRLVTPTLSLTSPRPTRSKLSLLLCSTSLWSA
jgi:hypothetical protein